MYVDDNDKIRSKNYFGKTKELAKVGYMTADLLRGRMDPKW